MGALDFLFGGTDDSAQAYQIQSNQDRLQHIRDQADAARADILTLFPAAETALSQGVQGALNTISGGVPQQISAFEQGNRGAQDITARGLGSYYDAIMGNPMDFSIENLLGAVSPNINVDTSFLNASVPNFFMSNEIGLPNTNGALSGSDYVPGTRGAAQSDITNTANSLGPTGGGTVSGGNTAPNSYSQTQIPQSGDIHFTDSYLADAPILGTVPGSQNIRAAGDQILANSSLNEQQKIDAILNEALSKGVTVDNLYAQFSDRFPDIGFRDFQDNLAGMGYETSGTLKKNTRNNDIQKILSMIGG